MPNSFDVIADSKAAAKRCFVVLVVGASAFLGTVILLIQTCCAVGYPEQGCSCDMVASSACVLVGILVGFR
jgi:hypothetical protein